ncbi:hypothetical protein Zmor_003126 [Zophobas morio]|uniref:Uncharacterized protein n=1 Tax=Zophobas morio TaxID=2755281 RepID=A0AA38M1Q7_9CUCU|nr:hypothetical protein Zmor_003126 [Zophobas morio]
MSFHPNDPSRRRTRSASATKKRNWPRTRQSLRGNIYTASRPSTNHTIPDHKSIKAGKPHADPIQELPLVCKAGNPRRDGVFAIPAVPTTYQPPHS